MIKTFLFQYICENHFQRLSKRSLFTGLKASNHFGRPDMSAFLRFVQRKHSYVSIFEQPECFVINVNHKYQVSKVGVFSCGPRAVTRANSIACEQVNRVRKLPHFINHFENFGWRRTVKIFLFIDILYKPFILPTGLLTLFTYLMVGFHFADLYVKSFS